MLIELRTTKLSVRAEVPELRSLCLKKGMFLPRVLTVQSEPVLSVWSACPTGKLVVILTLLQAARIFNLIRLKNTLFCL